MRVTLLAATIMATCCASNVYAQNTATLSSSRPIARGVLKLKDGDADASVSVRMWFTEKRGRALEVATGRHVVVGQDVGTLSLTNIWRRPLVIHSVNTTNPTIKCTLDQSDIVMHLQRVDDKYAYYKANVSFACVPRPHLRDTSFRYIGTLDVKLNVVCLEQDGSDIIDGDSTTATDHKFSTRPKFCVRHFPPNTPGLVTPSRATPKTNP